MLALEVFRDGPRGLTEDLKIVKNPNLD